MDVPTDATVGFVESQVAAGSTIIEVGCGSGHVAAQLSGRGYDVVGIDSDEQAVSESRKRGIDAVHASWPDFDGSPVDAVVFTRSLHHISPLREAIAKARELLKPGGIVLVEDFDFDGVDSAAINWLLEIISSRKGRMLIMPEPDDFVTTLSRADDPVQLWREDHDHHLHTSMTMTSALREKFKIAVTRQVPYLYRYLVPVLPQTSEAASFINEVLVEETRLGDLGRISLIGRRIVVDPV